jgi:diguanylate cyclase (GGDEF)-like protein/PAS domain S-box-containing protein
MTRAGHWHHGILLRSAAVLAATLLIASLASLAITVAATGAREHRAAETRLNQLLDTVENTVSVACFVNNAELADEVARGLVKNGDVLAAEILAEGRTLARRARAEAGAGGSGAAQERLVRSPFAPHPVIGQIRLSPNTQAIDAEIRSEAMFASLLLGGLLGMLAVAVIGVMLLFVVRPIKAMSDRLHTMNAEAGERVVPPRWHADTEIGRLAGDVNLLADRLVDAIDEERAVRREHEIAKKQYQSIFENAETGIFIVDRDAHLTSWNPAFARILAFKAQPQCAPRILDMPWENAAQLAELILECLNHNAAASADLAYRRDEGGPRWLNIVLSPVGDSLMQGVLHDVTDLKEAEASAKQLAVTDPLTGLANRSGLESRLRALMQSQTVGATPGFALILVDLDHFKHVNDGLGLSAGDDILKATGRRLCECVKGKDTVARLSADVFAVVLDHVAQGDAADKVAGRIMQSMRQNHSTGGTPVRVHASLGITLYPHDGAADPPSLLRNAELAVDRAKSQGGNALVFFDTALARAAEQRRHMENDLRQAIETGSFVLYYQPIVELEGQRPVGAEALIRWRHPEHGLVAPDRFIAIAEETGLIDDIGMWVLDGVCRQIAAWRGRGLTHYISLNVSGRQIPNGLPPSAVAEALRAHGIDPGDLALEITEGILMADVDKALDWLRAMHDLGVRIYLDDFGTGYSSLSYLKRFPVDTLKVDKSFVRDMSEDGSDRALVAAIVAMARSLNMDVVAEGVENSHQAALLRDMGCARAQGYLYSRPVPAEEFEAVLARLANPVAAMAPGETTPT